MPKCTRPSLTACVQLRDWLTSGTVLTWIRLTAGITPQMQQLFQNFRPPPMPPELTEAFRKM